MKWTLIFLLSTSAITALGSSRTYLLVPPAQTPRSVEPSSSPSVWQGYSELKHICSCESWGDPDEEPRQFDDSGEPLLGYPNPSDIGACQINRHYHQAEANKLGLDLASFQGNVAYAKVLYDRESSAPWLWSKSCWSR